MDTKGCLILTVGIFAIYSIASAIVGIIVLVDGDYYGSDIRLFYPIFALIFIITVGIIYNKYISAPREEIKNALHKMYNYPKRVVQEDGGQWGNTFLQIIGTVIENVTEQDKKAIYNNVEE